MSCISRGRSLKKDVDWTTIQYLRDKEHKSVKEIAAMFDVSESTINRHSNSPTKKGSTVDAGMILFKYNRGATVADISEEMGCHITTVYRILKKAGIKFQKYVRDKKEPKPEPELPKAEESVQTEPEKHDIYKRCQEVRQVGFYHGRLGTYMVGLEPGIVELPQIPTKMDKETLGYLIRDLQTMWQEV